MHRVLNSQKDERRSPIDQHYFNLWMAERSNVMTIASTTLVLPSQAQFVADVDSTMLIVFDTATAFSRQNDIGYLTLKTMDKLKLMWTRKSVDLNPALRGSQPLPVFEDINQPIFKTYLR